MKWNKTGALVLTAALVGPLFVPSTLAAEPVAPATRAEAAQQAAEYAAEYSGASSLQYALWEEGEITLSGHTGVYSRTENRAITTDTLYGVGSISKIYTTAAVMQLAEAGKLALDKPVTTYLPTFKMADERYRKITVEMLINHSSGLMGSTIGSGFLYNDPDTVATDDLLHRLSTQRLKADPGAFSVYCNDGFTLAELVVEAVSGQSFETYLQKNILAPTELTATYTPQDEFDRDLLAKAYQGEDIRAMPTETLGVMGTGGIYATASDLARFGGLFCGTELLTKNSLDAMAAPAYLDGLWPADQEDSLSYGLGWDSVKFYPFAYNEIQALVKGGDTGSYHGGLVVLPEYNMACAVLSSGGISTYNELAASRILVDALVAKGIKVDETEHTLPATQPSTMPESMQKYAGLYGSSMSGLVQIDLSKEGVMTMNFVTLGTEPESLFYQADGSFRDKDSLIMVKFVEEKNGEIYFWQKGYSPVPGLVELPSSSYTLQKLPEGSVSPEIQAVWEARTQNLYLSLTEKYSSQSYVLQILGTGIPYSQETPGYVSVNHISSADDALAVLQIPGVGGRDCADIQLYKKDGIEYLSMMGGLYVEYSAAELLFSGTTSYCTIQENGYARWYQVGNAAGKAMTVQVPEHASFYVYDQNGATVAGSWAYGDTAVTLPEGGWIVFAGDPGVRFQIAIASAKAA